MLTASHVEVSIHTSKSEFSKDTYGNLIPQLFLLNVRPAFYFPYLIFATSGICEVKQLPCLLVLINTLWEGLFPLNKFCVRSDKDKPSERCFSKKLEKCQILTSLWGWGLGELSNPTSSAATAQLLAFTPALVARLLVFKTLTEVGRKKWE